MDDLRQRAEATIARKEGEIAGFKTRIADLKRDVKRIKKAVEQGVYDALD